MYKNPIEKDTKYGSYFIYDTSTDIRLFLFFNHNYSDFFLCGFPIVMKTVLNYDDFQNIDKGSTIQDVEKIDSVVSLYEERFNYAPDDMFESYSNMNVDGISIHLLSDGILKIKYSRDNGTYIVKEKEYSKDFMLKCLKGEFDFSIDKNDYVK